MKKAIIITYYEAPNYGAFLQAYAMQSFLNENNVEAHICEHRANKKHIIGSILDIRADKNILAYRNNIQQQIDNAQRWFKFPEQKSTVYDLAIIGSDEVWNVKNLTAVHLPLFFKPYRNAKRTISYAVCAGNCRAKHLKLFPYTHAIKKLDAVSVRDSNTEKVVKEYVGITPERVLDPTFLYSFTREITKRSISEPYMLVYTYGLTDDSVNEVKHFAKNKGLKLVATGSNCHWADENPLPSPFEWLSLIKYCTYMVTSTFHGAVFSIKFEKQFAVIDTSSNKVQSLLEEMDLSARRINNGANIKDLFAETIDYTKVNIIKDKMVQKSSDFVLRGL